jgi:hypothetical protein
MAGWHWAGRLVSSFSIEKEFFVNVVAIGFDDFDPEFREELCEFDIAKKGGSNPPQEEKVIELAELIVTQLRRHGQGSVCQLDKEAVAKGLTGRTVLQVGSGVGGRGGLNLFRNRDVILGVADNVKNCITKMGGARAKAWMAKEGMTMDDLKAWIASLPSVK